MALGVFFGLLIPLAQIPVTAAATVALRANLPVAVAGTLISNPVTFAPICYTVYHLGSWATGKTALPSGKAEMSVTPEEKRGILQRIKALGKSLLAGLACLTGVSTYVLIDQLWPWRTQNRWRNRNGKQEAVLNSGWGWGRRSWADALPLPWKAHGYSIPRP